jgi:two-component system KDP operon response regulator KdpE
MKTASKRILIIDDEPDVRRAVRLTIQLQEPEWEVLEAENGDVGLLKVEAEQPDLVLLDLIMPDMNGFETLKQLRLFSDVPVIILTVRDDELDKVRGLELGADDYIVKPFGHLELMARLRSVLRRAEGSVASQEKPLVLDGLRIDFNTHQVTLHGEPIPMTATEYRLLELLARNVGRVVTYQTLLNRVWGRYAVDSNDYLKVYIHRLRQKLGEDPAHPHFIHTVRGQGYMLGGL